MTDQWPILSTITFLPLFGAFLIFLIKEEGEAAKRNIRNVAFLTGLFVFILSLIVWAGFDKNSSAFQLQEEANWLGGGLGYHMGIDGLSVLFVVLAAFLTPLVILASRYTVMSRLKEYMIAFLILETTIIGAFCSLNALLFYVFFEGSLIPMFIIIGVWGGEKRVYAALKFFLYTLFGSLLMLVGLMAMYWQVGSLDIPTLLNYKFSASMQIWLWFAFFASFAVKLPMWPVHTWLPNAYVQAPAAGTVMLSGILLKFGGYGFLRFSLPMFPLASAQFAPLILTLSVIAIIYMSLIALAQRDMKRLIAYSSVAHIGYVTMGIFSANLQAVEGAVFQMLSHGLIAPALFLSVGMLEERMRTREIAAYGGLVNNMPKYSAVFMVFVMANLGLPGTSGFIGELLTLIGTFQNHRLIACFAASGVIFSAAYMLYLYRRIIFGAFSRESLKALSDISAREKYILYPLAVLIVFFGLYPAPILNALHSSAEVLVNNYQYALSADGGSAFLQK